MRSAAQASLTFTVAAMLLTGDAAVAAPLTIKVRGTIEDVENGKRLNDITVLITVGFVQMGESVSKNVVENNVVKESVVFEVEAEIDDSNRVIDLRFRDRKTRKYLSDNLPLLVGRPMMDLVIPKALVSQDSPRADAEALRKHANDVRFQIQVAQRAMRDRFEIRKEFALDVQEALVAAQRFRLDEGLQADTGRVVRAWDARPSAALAAAEGGLTYRWINQTTHFRPNQGPQIIPMTSWKAGELPIGNWATTADDRIISSSREGGIVIFGGPEGWQPFAIKPDAIGTGAQLLVTAAAAKQLYASASANGGVTLYGGVSGQPQRQRVLFTGSGSPRGLNFSRDGSKLAAATLSGQVVVWAVEGGSELCRIDLNKGLNLALDEDRRRVKVPNAVSFSLDGSEFAVGTGLAGGGELVRFNLEGERLQTLPLSEINNEVGGVTGIMYTPDRGKLILEFDRQRGAILDIQTGRAIAQFLGALIPSANGERVALLHREELNKMGSRPPEIRSLTDFMQRPE